VRKIWYLFFSLALVGCSVSGGDIPAAAPVEGQVGLAQLQDRGDETGRDAANPNSTTLLATDEAATVTARATLEIGTTPLAALDLPPVANPNLDHRRLLSQILFQQDGQTPEILAEIRESRDTRFVTGLIDILRWRWDLSEDVGATLNSLTNQNINADWHDWVEWAGKHPDIESFESYIDWKSNLFFQIDPNFLRFVYPGMQVAPGSRVEEIVWGGVLVDGIPALDNPRMIAPDEADYLVAEERVFGVTINGDTRAYPARFLDWHEMFNDVIGGEPVSLAY
jgi:hypothetical protein